MQFEKLNITVSLEAKDILREYQKKKGLSNLDSATDYFILENSRV